MGAAPSRQGMAADIYIGPAGWSYDDWTGYVYPPGAASKFDGLAYLKDFFDTIEINSTFYRPPAPRTAESWVHRVSANDRFLFTVKLWQGFTHDPRRIETADVETFRAGIAPLQEAERLGAVLCQFPFSFHGNRENARYLSELFDAFAGLPLVLEVRHASWDEPDVYDWLRGKGVAFCNIDQPVIGAGLEPTREATSELGYIRLHGQNHENWFRDDAGVAERYDYLYDAAELEPWAEAVRALAGSLGRLFLVFNNHYRGQAAVNALEMMALLIGGPVAVPPTLLAAYPRLAGIAAAR